MINLADMSWSIIDVMCDMVAASGRTNHKRHIKIQARDALMKLGIPYSKEERGLKARAPREKIEE